MPTGEGQHPTTGGMVMISRLYQIFNGLLSLKCMLMYSVHIQLKIISNDSKRIRNYFSVTCNPWISMPWHNFQESRILWKEWSQKKFFIFSFVKIATYTVTNYTCISVKIHHAVYIWFVYLCGWSLYPIKINLSQKNQCLGKIATDVTKLNTTCSHLYKPRQTLVYINQDRLCPK